MHIANVEVKFILCLIFCFECFIKGRSPLQAFVCICIKVYHYINEYATNGYETALTKILTQMLSVNGP